MTQHVKMITLNAKAKIKPTKFRIEKLEASHLTVKSEQSTQVQEIARI